MYIYTQLLGIQLKEIIRHKNCGVINNREKVGSNRNVHQ